MVRPLVVNHDNWKAVELFKRCRSEWRHQLDGQPRALNWQGVLAVARFTKVKPSPALFDALRNLEVGALCAFQGGDIGKLLDGA